MKRMLNWWVVLLAVAVVGVRSSLVADTTATSPGAPGRLGAVSGYGPENAAKYVTVTFDAGSGMVAEPMRDYLAGNAYGEFPSATCAGCVFLGWHTAAVYGTRVDSGSVVRSDVTTLYAHWSGTDELRVENLAAQQRYPWNGKVDVMFDLNGVPEREYASLTLTAQDEGDEKAFALATYDGNAPTNLAAGTHRVVWDADRDKPNALFENLTFYATASIDVPRAPTSGTASNNDATDGIDLTWVAAHGASSYEIWRSTASTFGSASKLFDCAELTCHDGSCAMGTYYYYWIRSKSSGGVSPDALALEARRPPPTVSITFDGNGGTPTSQTRDCTADEPYGSFPPVSWSGYDFTGWYTAVSGGTQVTTSSIVPSANTTLYAHWSAIVPSAPTDVSATDGSHADKVVVSWSAVDGATSYYVYRHASNSSGLATQLASTVSTSYADTEATPGVTYYYWVRAYRSDNGRYGAFSSSNAGYRTLSAPTGVSAADGAYSDRVVVSWSAVTGATSYYVYRHTSNSSGSATQIGSTTSTSYTDTTASPGVTYYYWAKAYANSSSSYSDFSSCDTGYAQKALVSITINGPAALDAGTNATYVCTATYSDGTTATVTPSWSITDGSSYASIDSSGKLTANASTVDRSVTIRASYTANGITVTATKTVTIRKVISLSTALDNTDLVFTTGGSSNWVGVVDVSYDGTDSARSGMIGHNQSTWLQTTVTGPGTFSFRWKVSSESGYDKLAFVLDGTAKDAISGTSMGAFAEKSYTVESGEHSIKWIYSKDGSASNGSDCGWVDKVVYTPITKPNPPTGVGASRGASAANVSLSWSAVSGATGYEIWRGTSSSSDAATLLDTVTVTSYVDTTAVPGTTYYYWVKAINLAGPSGFSSYVTGYRQLSAPTSVSATDGSYSDKVVVSWSAVSGATSYYVYRHTSTSSGAATQLGSTTSASYADTTATPGVTYYYWVKAYANSSLSYSVFSSSDTGYRLKVPVSLAIFGPDELDAGTNAMYACTATFSDNAPATVTPSWSITDGSSYASIDSSGKLTANASTVDRSVTIRASYTANGITVTATKTVTIRKVIPLNVALDNADLVFVTGGDACWSGMVHSAGMDGGDIAVSGYIEAGQTSWIETTLTGPGKLSYYCYLSSKSNNDTYSTGLDGNMSPSFTGSNFMPGGGATAQTEMTVPAGTHTYRWSYTRATGGSAVNGTGQAWLDCVAYTPIYLPPAPTGLIATGGTSTDNVTMSWSSVSGATGYEIWRGTSSSSGSASLVGTVTTTSYVDTTADPGTTYYYWVKATNLAGTSGFGSYVTGYRKLSVPTGVSATDGAYSSRVVVSWTPVTGASAYYVYRHTSDNSGSATQLASTSLTNYTDTTASPDVTYYYWVRAYVNSSGSYSDFSSSDTGYCQLSAPLNVSATDGTYSDKVIVSWGSVSDATTYYVYRYTSNSSGLATSLGSTSSTSYADTTATPGTTYYYWVRAYRSDTRQYSGFSTSDSGYCPLPAPANVAASDGSSIANITISWSSVSGATRYYVYRNTSNSSSSATQIGTATSTSYTDSSSLTAGKDYYYWVRTYNGSRFSAYSASNSGYRKLAAPSGFQGWRNANNNIYLQWNNVTGAKSYKLYLAGNALDTTTGTSYTTWWGNPYPFYQVCAIGENGKEGDRAGYNVP